MATGDGHFPIRYPNAQTGCWLLGLVILSGCVTTTPDAVPSLFCPVTSTTIPPAAGLALTNQHGAILIQSLQKRLQERERTIATQTHQIEILSSQLEALKQIDQEARRQPRKALTYPIP